MMMEQIGEETSAILGKDFATRCHIPQEGSVVLHIVGDEMDWLITRIAIPTTKDRKYMFYIIVEVSHEKKNNIIKLPFQNSAQQTLLSQIPCIHQTQISCQTNTSLQLANNIPIGYYLLTLISMSSALF